MYRQPDQPLWPWPDNTLRNLTRQEGYVNWEHRHRGHDTPIHNCYSCVWQNAI